MKNFRLSIFLLFLASFNINAANYLISADAKTAGETLTHKGISFEVGKNAFADFATFAAANPEANSTVYVAPGTYSANAMIKTAGLKFLGNNANRDLRTSRIAESVITGQIEIEANDIEINGFKFTENGRIASTTGTNAAPLSGLKLTYNYITASTLARNNYKQVFQIGVRYANATAPTTAAQCRYKNCEISHNQFEGDATHYPAFIGLSGVYETTKVIDNKFTDGGTSMWISNAQGSIQVYSNVFKNVGKTTQSAPDGGNLGDYCVALYHSAYAGSTTLDVKNNEFDSCYGQGSTFSIIRLYPGADDNLVTPINCKLNIQRNVFKNKPMIHATNNYILYLEKGNGASVVTDIRDNTLDNNSYEFTWINGSGLASSTRERYYASNYNLITPGDCTFSTHQSEIAPGGVKIIQSFDIDHATGDIYFTQLDNNAAQTTMKSKYGDPASILLTKYNKSAGTKSTMQLAWSGHGTKVTLCRHNGKLYVFTGRATTLNSTSTETVSKGTAWFEFVAGAVVDCRKSSFTYGGKTYPVYSFENNGKTDEYPHIDEVSRLFVTRGKSSGNSYFRIYNLDTFLADPANATPIKTVVINKGSNPTSVSGDNGFNTWYFQSYAVCGDYIYWFEGVSAVDDNALASKPTAFVHAYNWRTNEFKYRVQLKNSALYNLTYGEPEGITVRRNSSGVAELYVGLANGAVGARKAIIFKYTPQNSKAVALANGVHTPSATSINLTSSDGAAASASLTITNKNVHGDIYTLVSSDDCSQFSVSTSKSTFGNESSTIKVTYTPKSGQATANAYLRISSPLATDVIIPLKGTNSNTGETPNPPAEGLGDDYLKIDKTIVTLSGVHKSTNQPFVDVKVTGNNLTSDITYNSITSAVTVAPQSNWDARTGGTLRITLNTNFTSGPGTYTTGYVAIQSTSAHRIELPLNITLTEAEEPETPTTPDTGLGDDNLKVDRSSITLRGVLLSSNQPYVDITVTGSGLTSPINANSNSGIVIVAKQSGFDDLTGGTIRATLNTQFTTLGAVTDKTGIVAVQSGAHRIEIPFTATLLPEGSAEPDDPTGDNGSSGIEEITIEETPIYYNLQGAKIDNPESGLYIRIQGGKAAKVFIKRR